MNEFTQKLDNIHITSEEFIVDPIAPYMKQRLLIAETKSRADITLV